MAVASLPTDWICQMGGCRMSMSLQKGLMQLVLQVEARKNSNQN